MSIFRKKNLTEVIAVAGKTELKKNLGSMDLMMLGLGAIIGSGIFVITGYAAANYAGPSITVSFILGAVACIFTALAYAELATMIPTAGSAYTYAYVTLGEGVAAFVGWIMVMVCSFGAATVGAGWSGYVVGILNDIGVQLPEALTKIPSQGGLINLPAMLIVAALSLFLVRGMEGVSKMNGLLVFVKLVAIFSFVFLAFPHISTTHWETFAPNGFLGIASGAGFVFMAYTGFDAVATAAEECKNPNRDLPIGIIGSLIGSALLYIVVSGTLTAIVPYTSLNNPEPMAQALRTHGVQFGAKLVAIGALTGMTTVILANIYALSRILMVMARDGLIPSLFAKVHSRFSTPYRGILIGGAVILLIAGLFPVASLGQICSMATLLVFCFVSVGVMVMRYKNPTQKRIFRCPAVYFVASTSLILCGFLFCQLLIENWMAFLTVASVGPLIYLAFGYRNSTANGAVIPQV